jgi:hypothetical protein
MDQLPSEAVRLDLPADLLRRAESYAARHGTTVPDLVREHLERLTSEAPAPARSEDPLVDFAEGRISKESAIDALGLRDYAQLLMALGERGLHPPRLPEEVLAPMQATFVRLLREARRERALHTGGS